MGHFSPWCHGENCSKSKCSREKKNQTPLWKWSVLWSSETVYLWHFSLYLPNIGACYTWYTATICCNEVQSHRCFTVSGWVCSTFKVKLLKYCRKDKEKITCLPFMSSLYLKLTDIWDNRQITAANRKGGQPLGKVYKKSLAKMPV